MQGVQPKHNGKYNGGMFYVFPSLLEVKDYLTFLSESLFICQVSQLCWRSHIQAYNVSAVVVGLGGLSGPNNKGA